jgi:hypothetical protein
LEGRESEGGRELEKIEEIEEERGRRRDSEGGSERKMIVWECWMSSLGMLGRREGGRER